MGQRAEAALIAHAPYRRLDGEAIGDECVAVELFQNLATGGTAVFALGRGRRRQLEPPKTGSALRASHIALFHSPRLYLVPDPIYPRFGGGTLFMTGELRGESGRSPVTASNRATPKAKLARSNH